MSKQVLYKDYEYNKCTEYDLRICFDLLTQLRVNLSFENFVQIFRKNSEYNQYKIIIMFETENRPVALVGYRIYFDFVRGEHIYIDDLVTSEKYRSLSYGSQLLSHLEKLALNLNIHCLRLSSALENERALQFYAREGWIIRTSTLVKKI